MLAAQIQIFCLSLTGQEVEVNREYQEEVSESKWRVNYSLAAEVLVSHRLDSFPGTSCGQIFPWLSRLHRRPGACQASCFWDCRFC